MGIVPIAAPIDAGDQADVQIPPTGDYYAAGDGDRRLGVFRAVVFIDRHLGQSRRNQRDEGRANGGFAETLGAGIGIPRVRADRGTAAEVIACWRALKIDQQNGVLLAEK